MKKTSIWLDDKLSTDHQKLEENINVDVLIIGGGITGLSCGYHLIGSDLTVAIVEANKLGMGVTSKTTGKLTFLQEDIYSKITNISSKNNAKLYYESQKHAIDLVKNIVTKHNISCNLEKSNSYLFTNSKTKIDKIKNEARLLRDFGEKIILKEKLPLEEVPCKYAIEVSGCYVFHPLKYLSGLEMSLRKNKIAIYENTRIIEIKKYQDYYLCKSFDHQIKAKKVVLALHYPFFLSPYFFPMKVCLEKSYIGASLQKNNLKFNAINIDNVSTSIRYHADKSKNYQLLLHYSRNISTATNDSKNFQNLQELPYEFDYLWSNIDIITSDHLPYIGKIKENLFLATGYNTWGMTNGSLAGEIIADLIKDKENRYSKLLSPNRALKISKLPLILGSSLKGFKEGFLNQYKMETNITYSKRNGKKVATYTDANGKKHSVYLLCPHLKCSLIFNEVEKTWDCPCHGSRFNIDGKCLEGPSNYDIAVEDVNNQVE